jgi:hypothetical protein
MKPLPGWVENTFRSERPRQYFVKPMPVAERRDHFLNSASRSYYLDFGSGRLIPVRRLGRPSTASTIPGIRAAGSTRKGMVEFGKGEGRRRS